MRFFRWDWKGEMVVVGVVVVVDDVIGGPPKGFKYADMRCKRKN